MGVANARTGSERASALGRARPRSNFLVKHYKELKGANPTLPILVRECAGVEPKLWARFGAPARPSATPAGA